MAPSLQRGDHGQADRAAPDDEAGLALGETGQTHGVLAHGQRLGQRGELGADGVGHREAQQLLEHHVLGEGARVGVGVADLFHPCRPEDDWHRADAGPHGQRGGGTGPVLHHFGAELVAEHAVGLRVEGGHAHRVHQPGEMREVGQGVQVGSTDSGGQRAHHDVARGRHGVGHLAHDQPSAPRHCGTHAGTTPRAARPPAFVATFAR